MCISNILANLCFTKERSKTKKPFLKSCLQCFSSKNVCNNHKEVCLSISGAKSVRFEKGTMDFKNHFKQIPVPFKYYADFECNLNSVESYEGSCSKSIKITFLVVLLTSLFVLMISLVSRLLFTEVKILLLNLLKQFLKNMNTVKMKMKKYFNKNLIVTEEEGQF